MLSFLGFGTTTTTAMQFLDFIETKVFLPISISAIPHVRHAFYKISVNILSGQCELTVFVPRSAICNGLEYCGPQSLDGSKSHIVSFERFHSLLATKRRKRRPLLHPLRQTYPIHYAYHSHLARPRMLTSSYSCSVPPSTCPAQQIWG